MAHNDDPNNPGSPGSGEEQPFRLDHEITRKYDPSALSRLIMRDAGRGEPLDLHTRMQMERRLGGDFSSVRLFRGPLAEEVTARYRADAVTVGGTEMILVREGWRSNFQTAAGQSLLAHELTHVQQQQRGLHFRHSHDGGENSDIEHEAEAVEAITLAESQGEDIGAEAERRRHNAEKELWNTVRDYAQDIYEKHYMHQNERTGEAVSERDWDQ